MILITHDLGVVAEFCDKVSVIYSGRVVEHGTVEQIFESKEKHPYTEGLIHCIPSLEDHSKRLKPIPGRMPDPRNLPEGCSFADRCPYASEACKKAQPQAYEKDGHMILCNRFSKKEAK